MDQILQDKVLEDWDLTSNAQHMKYILYNSADIEKKFLPESTNMDFFHSKRSKWAKNVKFLLKPIIHVKIHQKKW